MTQRWISLAAAAAVTGLVPTVQAQDQDTAGAATLDEIVVTARKREESVQEIPFVVNALTAEQMERASIQGLGDIALRTPGLNYEGYASAGQAGAAVIRGLAPTQLTNRIPNVAVFYDGVYLQNQALQDIGVFDIERVEVLKGPQSALYGRNAFAGAINYISRKPSNDWRAEVGATVGSDDRRDVNAFLSGPLSPDRVFFKLSYGQTEADGTWDNNHPLAAQGTSPGSRGNVGGWDTETVTAGLTIRPTDGVEVNLGYFKSDISREPNGNYTIQGFLSVLNGIQNFNDLNCLPRTAAPAFPPGAPAITGNQVWCGELPLAPPSNPMDNRPPGVVVDPRQLGLQADSEITTASMNMALGESLELFYLFGRNEYTGLGGGPNDRNAVVGNNTLAFSPCPSGLANCNTIDSRPNGTLRSTSHELRLQSTADSAFSWMAGLYYSDVDEEQTAFTGRVPPLSLTPIFSTLANNNLNKVRFADRIRNVFALADYRFNDAWSVAAEARYGDEDKEIFRITNATGGAFTAGAAYQQQDYQPFTWRASVNFKPKAGVLTYLSAAKGEKTGGFNVARYPLFLNQGEFDAETNTTIELGIKSDWLDGRLRLNAAIYTIDWEDLQASTPQFTDNAVLRPLTPQDPAVISNIGGAESTGLELELGYIFTPHFNATLALAFNDPKYKDAKLFGANAIPPVGTPTRANPPLGNIRCDGVLCNADGSIDGNSLERQSKISGALLLSYGRDINEDWSYYTNLDINYQGKQYIEALNLGWTAPRTITNLRIGLSNEKWEAALWARNLLDEEYAANSFVITFANSYVVGLGERRTFGVTAKYKF
jgi:iron complex outermembrane receptor protein